MDSKKEISTFLSIGFSKSYTPKDPSDSENKIINRIKKYVDSNISGVSRPRKYVLGLAFDFTLLAQRISSTDTDAKKFRPTLTEAELFDRYKLVTKRGSATANTLSLVYNDSTEGIRKLEEHVVAFFHRLNRTGYPSAYVYNTGQWHKYKDLLVMCFQLSENGRFALCLELINYGFSIIPQHKYFGRKTPRTFLFERVLKDYKRSSKNENGGLVFQSIAHGFIASDRPHLSIIADKVRTGSARQKRFGDIDCYSGLDLELSVEVKDLHIGSKNFTHELGSFMNEVKAAGIKGMAIVQCIEDTERQLLEENDISVIDLNDIQWIVHTWDWPKQNQALQTMLHHIAHIEQNTEATQRLMSFIKSIDPNHDSLTYDQSDKAN